MKKIPLCFCSLALLSILFLGCDTGGGLGNNSYPRTLWCSIVCESLEVESSSEERGAREECRSLGGTIVSSRPSWCGSDGKGSSGGTCYITSSQFGPLGSMCAASVSGVKITSQFCEMLKAQIGVSLYGAEVEYRNSCPQDYELECNRNEDGMNVKFYLYGPVFASGSCNTFL
jgi:hypothetical protein